MQFLGEIENLSTVLQWIKGQIGDTFDSRVMKKIELASEEVFVNIIQHGYKGQIGKIEIEVNSFPDRIEISFTDNGPPFNPLKEKKEIDHKLPIEEREVGGLGIYLVKQLVDEVRYERTDHKNRLIISHFFRTK